MFARFFIDRPIFAGVLSIVITIAGLVALTTLPIAQYPDIAPPTIQVAAAYPGASAQVVTETIATPIEEQINGVENMLYMSSQSANDGSYNLTVTFKLGTPLDMAQVLVQNRVSLAMPGLPDVVKLTGVSVRKRSPDILLVVQLYSPDGRYDQLYLSNYAAINIRDELARIEGIGDVFLFGQQDYSMRAWLDPEKLATRNLTAGDVTRALREQNVQVAAGQIAQPPVSGPQDFQYTLTTLGRLTDPQQFGQVVIKSGTQGQVVRLQDVARIELGAKSEDQVSMLDGKINVGIALFQRPGTNALATADAVREKMTELKSHFPVGLDYAIVYDTTPFVRESVQEVVKTLFEAFVLVGIVVLVFLQSWRASIIPLIAVPVSLIGTFAVMYLLGYSLNNLTLFGLVLAIGIVVDDAIVVVENVERWLEKGLAPREAAYKTMDEVTGAVIAIAFGLSAVFIPTAFVSGIPGQFYKQFALTIATATLISAFNSLTLSPALAAIILKPRHEQTDILTRALNASMGWFFSGFNRLFEMAQALYGRVVARVVRGAAIALLVYFLLLGVTAMGLLKTPLGFIPPADKGYLLGSVELPDASSLERTKLVMQQLGELARETPGIKHAVTISGRSFVLNAAGSNYGSIFIILDEFEKRKSTALTDVAIANTLRHKFNEKVLDAQVVVFGPPAVSGLGNVGGFRLMVEDRGDNGLQNLQTQAEALVDKSRQEPALLGLFSQFRASTPQLYVDVDRTKCKTMNVPLSEVFDALQIYLGGYYVNDFNRFGRTWQVNVQADARFRERAESLQQLKVRSADGAMVPLGSLAEIRDASGPLIITRYNMYPAAPINGLWAPGYSSGEGIAAMNALADRELPRSMAVEWTELTYLEILAGNTAIFIFPLCVLFVFLTHSAEYESWSLPLGIILIVPLSVLFALVGVWIRGEDNNLFTQIGFVVLAGLACKNAVLIIEFAKQQREHGKSIFDAAVEASRLRLRPIIMTSLAFILGVLPLVVSRGAGFEMRQTLGTAVFSGMIGVTIAGILLTPVFYYVLQNLVEKRGAKRLPPPGIDYEIAEGI
jgi:multidrug efflux pump